MLKISPLTLLFLAAVALPARAEPPADVDACIALSAETARAANIQTEADYVKFHSKLLNLDAACGARDFVEAEKISREIKATFPPNK
ncbi:MAG: hypothetical protein J0H65_01115 [Rhizobiales bacterium]|nr:hypothetical protein [Hyphomicrobiales bacterium]